MSVNEHLIQLRGKATIDRPLAYDRDYIIHGKMSVASTKSHPNGDGSEDITYVLEPTEFTIQNDAGKSVNLKKKSSLSQAMRMQIVMWVRDNMPEIEDDDQGYEIMMKKIMDRLPSILIMLKDKD